MAFDGDRESEWEPVWNPMGTDVSGPNAVSTGCTDVEPEVWTVARTWTAGLVQAGGRMREVCWTLWWWVADLWDV